MMGLEQGGLTPPEEVTNARTNENGENQHALESRLETERRNLEVLNQVEREVIADELSESQRMIELSKIRSAKENNDQFEIKSPNGELFPDELEPNLVRMMISEQIEYKIVKKAA